MKHSRPAIVVARELRLPDDVVNVEGARNARLQLPSARRCRFVDDGKAERSAGGLQGRREAFHNRAAIRSFAIRCEKGSRHWEAVTEEFSSFFHPQLIAECADKASPTLDQMVDFIIQGLQAQHRFHPHADAKAWMR
jgi:hypothetical protein